MNKVSLPINACLCLWAALLPLPSLAQKSAPEPAAPRSAASPPASEASLGLSPQEALAQKQMLADDKRLDRLISLDVISVPLDEVLQKESVKESTGKGAKPNADAKPGTDTSRTRTSWS